MSDRFTLSFECQQSWEQMTELAPGQRRCERCSETVVDLSRLTRKQALAVVSVPDPPCVSYLRRQDGSPVFARPTWGNGLLAAAAGLLAACAAPSDEPACELAPEPAREAPLPAAPLPGAPAAVEQIGGPAPVVPEDLADTARGDDPNAVDGASGGGAATGPDRPPPYTRVRGRIRSSTRTADVPTPKVPDLP